MEEAHIHQVHGGMFAAASIGINRHPIAVFLRVKGVAAVIRAEVAHEVPAGAHEGVHRIGFAFRRAAAGRAGGEAPGGVQLERAFTGGQPFHVIRQQHGQLLFGNGQGAAVRAVDNRDGRAPIALARDEPIVQAVSDRALANAQLFDVGDGGFHRVFFRGAAQGAGIDHRAVRFHRGGHLSGVHRGAAFGLDDHANGQIVLAREFKVALVVGGHRHDSAAAVAHQDVIGRPHGHAFPADRVERVRSGEDAGFGAVGGFALDIGLAFGLFLIGAHGFRLFGRGEFIHQRVFRREDHKGHAPQSVGSGGKDLNWVTLFGCEGHGRAFGPADPLGLEGLDRLRPVNVRKVQ